MATKGDLLVGAAVDIITREQHQTARLNFQHSCHEEEASWPKGQNKSHCDAQGNVFTFVLNLLNCFCPAKSSLPHLNFSFNLNDCGSIIRQIGFRDKFY